MDNNYQSLNDFLDFDFKSFSSFLSSIPPLELGFISGIIGTIISAPLSSSELNTIGNFLEAIGQVMLTIQAQIELVTPSYPSRNEFDDHKKNINKLFNDIMNNRNIKK